MRVRVARGAGQRPGSAGSIGGRHHDDGTVAVVHHVVAGAPEREFVAHATRADDDKRCIERITHLHQYVSWAAVHQLGPPPHVALARQHRTPLESHEPLEVVAMAFGRNVLSVDHRHQADRMEYREIEIEPAGDVGCDPQCSLRVARPIDTDDHRACTDDAVECVRWVGHHPRS